MDDRLPEGEVQWGFLHLEPSSGQLKINQEMVDSHARELRQQLQSKSKSIIEWVQGTVVLLGFRDTLLTFLDSLEFIRGHFLQFELWKSCELLRT